MRRQRYAARIWPLGDRVLFELVDHIAGRFGIEDDLDSPLERFAGLDHTVLRALGGDRLPPVPPPRLVGGQSVSAASLPPSVEIRRVDCPVHGRALDGAGEK